MTFTFNQDRKPHCKEIPVLAGTGFNDFNLIVFDGVAVAIQITNESGQDIKVRLNGDPQATFTLAGHMSYEFNESFFYISQIDFSNTESGSTDASVQVIAGVVKQ